MKTVDSYRLTCGQCGADYPFRVEAGPHSDLRAVERARDIHDGTLSMHCSDCETHAHLTVTVIERNLEVR